MQLRIQDRLNPGPVRNTSYPALLLNNISCFFSRFNLSIIFEVLNHQFLIQFFRTYFCKFFIPFLRHRSRIRTIIFTCRFVWDALHFLVFVSTFSTLIIKVIFVYSTSHHVTKTYSMIRCINIDYAQFEKSWNHNKHFNPTGEIDHDLILISFWNNFLFQGGKLRF